MKKCARCLFNKEKNNFNKNKSRKDGLSIHCRDCMKFFQKKHYLKSEKRRNAIRNREEHSKTIRQQIIFNFLKNNPCVDCGETDPIVLQFDHVRGKKEFAIAETIRKGFSTTTLIEEIKKCEIRCANCHMRKTAKQFNWWITKFN